MASSREAIAFTILRDYLDVIDLFPMTLLTITEMHDRLIVATAMVL
ncbi:hypothetical protein [Pleurocapsa sp. CCALA 161]|nr:hypothetical protein [Pleurocapsa sp. CCALA 161]